MKTEKLMIAEKGNLKQEKKNLIKRRQGGRGEEEHSGWAVAQSVKRLP